MKLTTWASAMEDTRSVFRPRKQHNNNKIYDQYEQMHPHHKWINT